LWLVTTTRAQAMSAPEEEVDGVRSCFQAGREPTSWLSWSLPQVVWGMTGTNSFWNILDSMSGGAFLPGVACMSHCRTVSEFNTVLPNS